MQGILERAPGGDRTPSVVGACVPPGDRSATDDSVASRHWAEAQLEICGRSATRTVLVPPESKELVVGAGRSAGLRLDDRTVSRRHCRFFRAGAWVMVEDLGSRHGTTVAGDALRGPRRLRHGDEIRIGQSVLRFLCYFELIADGASAPASKPRSRDVSEPAPPHSEHSDEAPPAPPNVTGVHETPPTRRRLVHLATVVRRCWIPLAAVLVAAGVIAVVAYAVRAVEKLPVGGLN